MRPFYILLLLAALILPTIVRAQDKTISCKEDKRLDLSDPLYYPLNYKCRGDCSGTYSACVVRTRYISIIFGIRLLALDHTCYCITEADAKGLPPAVAGAKVSTGDLQSAYDKGLFTETGYGDALLFSVDRVCQGHKE